MGLVGENGVQKKFISKMEYLQKIQERYFLIVVEWRIN